MTGRETEDAMRVGIELANEHRWPRPSAVAGMARGAEALGYPTLWVRALPGRWLEAIDLLAVAAGAARTINLGVSGATPPLGRVADTVEAELPAMRDRLLVALPGAALLGDDTNTRRLRCRAKLLETLEPEIATVTEDAVALPIHGFFAGAGGPDLELGRELVARCRAKGHDLELMVRAPVAADDPFDDTIASLLAVRSAGVDEVVLAADESSVDRTMALYATMAEHLESASQSSSIPS